MKHECNNFQDNFLVTLYFANLNWQQDSGFENSAYSNTSNMKTNKGKIMSKSSYMCNSKMNTQELNFKESTPEARA